MKNQPVILLVIAAGCGLVAMFGVKQAISKNEGVVVETIQVLSATTEIQPGERLTELNTKFIEIAASSVPEGAVTNMEEVEERALTVPVTTGDWILKNKLGEKGQLGMEAVIPPGMATVTIPVDATTSHSGMLQPGNRIDLILTYDDNTTGRSLKKTITVLEFVEVFAVDNRVYGIDKEGGGQAKNITLLVTPEQGKAVTLAGKIGTMSTMMRHRGASEESSQGEISEEWLTSSAAGNNLEAPSVMDVRDGEFVAEYEDSNEGTEQADGEASDAAHEEKPTTVDDLLAQELSSVGSDPGGSGPVPKAEPKKKNTWTMEIYEGESVRLEAIEIAEAAEDSTGASKGIWSLWDKWKSQ